MVRREIGSGLGDSWWDNFKYTMYLMKRNAPFNPWNWMRLYQTVTGERETTYGDIGASVVWTLPVWAGRAIVPRGTSVGYSYSTIVAYQALKPGASTLVAPSIALFLVNRTMQLGILPDGSLDPMEAI